MANELVSVIVPIYNVKDYLKKCLKSINEQTYKNIEVWLVDDGSTDGSGEIADKFAKKNNKKFNVIHKENGGLSDARNAGLEKATGKYVTFVDSDDTIHPEFIERIVIRMEDTGSSVGIGDYVRRNISDDKDSDAGIQTKTSRTEVVSGRQAVINAYKSKAHGWSFTTWGKIYTMELFDSLNLLFPKGRIHEDAYTTYKLLYNAGTVIYVDKDLYYYSVRPDSIMTHKLDSRNLDGPPATRSACEYFIDAGDIEIASMAVNYHLRYLFYLDYWFRKNKNITSEELLGFEKNIREDSSRYARLKFLPFKKIVAYRLAAVLKFGPLLSLVKMEN